MTAAGSTAAPALPAPVAASVMARIVEDEHVDEATAARWLQGTLQFLEVCAATPHPSVPSGPIDAGWHAFILHTRPYMQWCEEHLGGYVHHAPTPPDVKEAPDTWMDAQLDYARTRLEAQARFGELDPEVWPVP